MREKLEHIDNRTLYLNLIFTQCVLFVIGCSMYFFFLVEHLEISHLFAVKDPILSLGAGILFAIFVISLDIWLMRILPRNYFDDGGVNERLFRDVNILQIGLIALLVSFVEEWLFRGVLQNLIGLVWTSLIFAAIHFRYFRKWIYALLIVSISFGFGILYEWTNSLWSVIIAHFLIDFCLGVMIRYKYI
jgi:membrane protease YdiL (CAAX protease family)